ncbi:RsfS/YbeB/iojap family protein, partial [Staphylococcus epidermidis]|uniref:RsfS/YbeB/iojap family protein n=1 Tax=Staphylococcus epidermidis TaxID=1282 RepID=UPI0037DA0E5B
ETAESKKRQGIISLSMNEVTDITHYFLLSHANNQPQLQSIPTSLKQLPHKHHIHLKPIQPYQQPPSILIH